MNGSPTSLITLQFDPSKLDPISDPYHLFRTKLTTSLAQNNFFPAISALDATADACAFVLIKGSDPVAEGLYTIRTDFF